MPIFIRACSLGFMFVPLTVMALSDLPPEQRGNASGLFNLTRELGGSIGTAWMSSMLNRSLGLNLTTLSSYVDVYGQVTQEQLAGIRAQFAGRVFDAINTTYRIMELRISGQALVRAFNVSFTALAFAFLFALVLVLMLKKPAADVTVEGAH
jgi:MFS transporter, DHA2 family, multidrug resistance protein